MGWLSKMFRFKSRDPDGIEEIPEGNATGLGIYNGSVSDWIKSNFGDDLTKSAYATKNLYSLLLARMCIDKIATECSKAIPQLSHPNKRLAFYVSKYPNETQDITQFLYQLVTYYLTDNNAFILPIYNSDGKFAGMFPAGIDRTQIVEIKDELYVKYQKDDGHPYLVPYSDCGQLKRMQYKQTLMGDSNAVFAKVAALFEENTDRATAMLKSGGLPIQWIGKLNVGAKDDMIEREQELFHKRSINGNKTGIILTDNRFEDIKQITKEVKTLIPDDLKILEEEAYSYWGVSKALLTNQYTEDDWNGFYQSRIEPILIQIGNVLSRMIYSDVEIMYQEKTITMMTDRLQYASIKSRLDVAFGAFDRGMTTLDDSRKTLNMAPLPDGEGDHRFIRGEYRPEGEGVVEDTAPDSDPPMDETGGKEAENDRNNQTESDIRDSGSGRNDKKNRK